MKQKVFTLMALLMSFFTTSWAADAKTVDDLTAITDPTIIKMEVVNGGSTLTAGTLYADGKLLSMGNGNAWSTSKGSTTYNSVEYKNVYQIKTNRQMAIKLGFNAKITVVGEKKSGRKWQIGTTDGGKEVAEGADNEGVATGMVTASASAPKVVYITASSDLYIGAIIIETANPVLTVKVNPSLLDVNGDWGEKDEQEFKVTNLNEGDDLKEAISSVWNGTATDYYEPDAKYALDTIGMPENKKMTATDLTISLKYTPKVYKLNYKYAFGGIEPDQIKIKNVEYAYGTTLPTQATPNIPGYTWDEQFFVNGDPQPEFPVTMPAANTNVVANLQADGLSIYYYVDGALVHTENPITVNSSIPDYAPESEREFSGWKWYDADNKEIVKPSKMPAYSLTAIGHLKYNVNFTADAKTYAEASFFSGEKVTLPTTQPTKEGYDFVGWANIPAAGTMPANDLEVSAEFSVNKYKISYQLDGKAYGETTEQYYGTTITQKDAPTLETGYSFSGWKLADGSAVPAKMPAKDITIVGTRYNVYTLTFKVDGKEYDKQELKYDAKVVIPDAPKSPEGREFSGWDHFGAVPAKMPASNVTINAGYKYLLTYNKHKLDNVTGEPTDEIIKHESVEYFYGDAIQPVVDNDDPEKYVDRDADWATKYTFKWADMPKDGKMVAKDLTVLATYSAKNYKIQYKVDDENYGDPVEVPFGSLVSWIEEPTAEGKTFTGWMYDDGTGAKFVTELLGFTMPNANIVVFGTFGDTKTMTYMDEDGKKNLNMQSKFAANQPVKYNDIPAKEGYYGKWLLAKLKSGKKDEYESTGKVVKTQNPNEAPEELTFETDTVVMLKYDIRQFSITYIKDDNVADAETKTKDFNKDVDAAPAPAGSDWVYFKVNEDGSEEKISKPSKYPAYDINAYSYTQYTIHYFVNGEPYQTRKYYYKDVVADYTVLPNIDEAGPEIEGYQFNGWNYDVAMPESSITEDEDGNIIKVTMPQSDVYVNAKLAKFYTVKYIVNGAEWTEKTEQVAEGDTYIVADVEEGYTLENDEWTDEPGNHLAYAGDEAEMPQADVTYYGTVTANVYNVQFFDANYDEFGEAQEVEFGATITLPETAPEKRGYTFEKWFIVTEDPTTGENVEVDLPETMPAAENYRPYYMDEVLNVYPKFTANEYTLTLMLDGKVWKQFQVATDTPLDDVLALDENNPEKDEKLIAEGYTFYGWDVYNEAMPAQNYVIKGTGAQATGINGVAADDQFSDVVAWYTTEGKLLAAPVKGAMNIAKMSDGSMKKILVK